MQKAANRFRGYEKTPGEGAGIKVDFLAKPRRSRAAALARAQCKR